MSPTSGSGRAGPAGAGVVAGTKYWKPVSLVGSLSLSLLASSDRLMDFVLD